MKERKKERERAGKRKETKENKKQELTNAFLSSYKLQRITDDFISCSLILFVEVAVHKTVYCFHTYHCRLLQQSTMRDNV